MTPPVLSPTWWPAETLPSVWVCVEGHAQCSPPGSPSVCPRTGRPIPAPLPVPEADGALSPASARPRVVARRLGSRGWLLGERGWALSAQGLVGGGAPAVLRLGHVLGCCVALCILLCPRCRAMPPCAPRAGSDPSAEPPDPPLPTGASSTCSLTWPRRCTRPGCWPSSSSRRLSPPGKCHACSGQGAFPVSTQPLRADAAAAILAGVRTRAGDPCQWLKAATLHPHGKTCRRSLSLRGSRVHLAQDISPCTGH